MSMTIGRLHKQLGELIAKGHARKPVCADKGTFFHALESDGCTILGVEEAALTWVPTIDDDGGTKVNADGTESGKTCLVLRGDDPLDSLGRRLQERPSEGTEPK